MSKDTEKKALKAIPQKGEELDIRKYLPFGTMAEIAREYKKTHQTIMDVAKGKLNNPIIRNRLMKIAIDHQAEITRQNMIAQENEKLQKQLCS